MKKITLAGLFVALLAGAACTGNQAVPPAIPQDKAMEKKIDKILKGLSLEEKVGQMCQLTVSMVSDYSSYPEFKINDALLDTAISKYKVGSILNVPFDMAQTPEVWNYTIKKIQDKSMEVLGIPCLYGADMIHGATYTRGAVFYPQEINLAASFNVDLAVECAKINAYETRACNVPWTFAPVMDLGRNPVWSRMWESFGEDAYLNAAMASATVKALQGEDPNAVGLNNVAACLKHYMCYGVPVSGKDRTPSSVTERDMREKYFAPFLASIRAGALSVMVNSANNSGIPFHANKELLTGWLKEQLNWDGLIVTDWADINNLYTRDHVAESKKDAVRIAINAGIDMAMVPSDWDFCPDLIALVKEGEVPMSRIDDAVRRVLRLKFRLGLFDEPYADPSRYDKFACDEFKATALKAAEESQVLLKNDDSILPLKPGTKIFVTGPNANSMRTLNGGWSYTWQGHGADEFSKGNTILAALRNKFGASNVTYEAGVSYAPRNGDNWWEESEPQIAKAVAASRGADVIIACVGENSYCETPGNTDDINLSENQKNLVRALAATGKPVVLVLNEGRPRIVKEIEPLAKAVVHVLLPGDFGGDAFANLISGEANFSAKLPFTYPKHINSFATYDYKPCERVETMAGEYNYDAKMDIQWAFGYGLSYTTFEYSNLKASKTSFTAADELTFTVDVKNTGKVAGAEPVLLFTSDLVASVSPDVRRLRAFTKVNLLPGETKTVSLTIKASDLAFVAANNKWTLEKGQFRAAIGTESVMLHCTADKVWETPNI